MKSFQYCFGLIRIKFKFIYETYFNIRDNWLTS